MSTADCLKCDCYTPTFFNNDMGPSDMSVPRSAPPDHTSRPSPSLADQTERRTAAKSRASTMLAESATSISHHFTNASIERNDTDHKTAAQHRRRTSHVEEEDAAQCWPVHFQDQRGSLTEAQAPLAVRLGLVEPDEATPYVSSSLFPDTERSAEPCSLSKEYNQESHYVHRKLHGYYLLAPPPRGKDRAESNSASRPSSPDLVPRSSPFPNSASHSGTSPGSGSAPPGPTPIASPSLSVSPASPRPSEILLGSESSSVVSGLVAPAARRPQPRTAESSSTTSSSDSRSTLESGRPRTDGVSSRKSSPAACEPAKEVWPLEQYFITRKSRVGGCTATERYHAYQPNKLPWRFSYNTESIITQELWHHIAYEVIGRHLLSEFPGDIMPRRVLDVGCGPGMWIVDVARQPGWEQTEFIGLDAVPCQTLLLDPALARRVSWVVANALDGLGEFPEASFDFVHCRFLGNNSVPEDSWPDLVAAMVRVLAPGGRLEILEADVAFYGTPHRIPAHELKELAAGVGNIALRLNTKNGRHGEEFDPLERVCLRALEQRGIGFSPLAQLPAVLMMEHDLTDVRFGNPRVLPLMAEPGFAPSGPRRDASPASPGADAGMKAKGETKSPQGTNGAPSKPTSPSPSLPEPSRNPAYTTRAPVGAPLRGSTFRMPDLELIRCMMLMGEVHLYTGSRYILWQEAEADKKAAGRPSSRYGPSGDVGEPYPHPWSDEAAFHRTLDRWVEDITRRAAVRALLKRTLGWNSDVTQVDKPCDATSTSVPFATHAKDPWSSKMSSSSVREASAVPDHKTQALSSMQSAEASAQLHKSYRERRKSPQTPSSSRPVSPKTQDLVEATSPLAARGSRLKESVPSTPRIPKIPLLGVKRTTGFTAIRRPARAAS